MRRQQLSGPQIHRAVINIGSVSATMASVNRGDYCISKAGIAMATRLWATRLAEFGISVYEVRPGLIETDMTAGVRSKYDALIESGMLLEKRWGTPTDISRAVSILARGELPYATGSVLFVDGGLALPRFQFRGMSLKEHMDQSAKCRSRDRTASAASPAAARSLPAYSFTQLLPH
jgi:3-oxoacyl-[acyl-carrier protein] reductase